MKRSSGENAPVARSSRSQTERSLSWMEGSVVARRRSSVARSGGTRRLISRSPWGGIKTEGGVGVTSSAILNLVSLVCFGHGRPLPPPGRAGHAANRSPPPEADPIPDTPEPAILPRGLHAPPAPPPL